MVQYLYYEYRGHVHLSQAPNGYENLNKWADWTQYHKNEYQDQENHRHHHNHH